MIFTEMPLAGAFTVDVERRRDDRGFFARTWCADEFKDRGLESVFVQANVCFNHRRGTLRGMHYQVSPFEETKLVRCSRGAVYDVIVDLRPKSATYAQWTGVELSQENSRAVYVPRGFAHGYQTLTDDAEVVYQVSQSYHPTHERGVRYDDPAIGIQWPQAVTSLSEKDSSHPVLRRAACISGGQQ